jgi:predicted NBD/HSP70 family sugar kinase
VENDIKLAAVGYYYAHLAKEYDHLVYIYVGNGMGSGIIINRKLMRGANNFAGELGFMAPLDGKEPEKPYNAHGGYLESQIRQFINYERREFESPLHSAQRKKLVSYLANAAANYVAILNPNAIVLGGEAFSGKLLDEVIQQMKLYTAAESMPEIVHDDNPDTGIEGLVSTCRIGLNTRTQLVQDGGV